MGYVSQSLLLVARLRRLTWIHESWTGTQQGCVITEGDLVAVIVRDARTGVVLARVPAGDLASLGGPQASAGLLFERRG